MLRQLYLHDLPDALVEDAADDLANESECGDPEDVVLGLELVAVQERVANLARRRCLIEHGTIQEPKF